MLRQPELSDLQSINDYASDIRASRFLLWSPHSDLSQTRQFLQGCIDSWEKGERLAWVVRVENKVVGMIEAKLKGRNAGIGYVIAPHAWGHGYATEALCTVSEALFRCSPIDALFALCVTDNPASARVLEKCSFVRERVLPNYFPCPNLDDKNHDAWFYARHREADRS
jgi:RimJ/RimL family protein N-acetyltransferase